MFTRMSVLITFRSLLAPCLPTDSYLDTQAPVPGSELAPAGLSTGGALEHMLLSHIFRCHSYLLSAVLCEESVRTEFWE